MKLNKKLFFPVVILIVSLLLLVSFNLESVSEAVGTVYSTITDYVGSYMIVGFILCFSFMIWISFSRFGKKRLGGENAKPEYSTFSWLAMIIATGASAGTILLGFTQVISYAANTLWHAEPYSEQAYEYAGMFLFHHWGLIACSSYVPLAMGLAYLLYNRNQKRATISAVIEVGTGKSNSVLGYIIDIVTITVIVLAPITSMGLGMPVLCSLFQSIFGFPDSFIPTLQIIILVILVLLFGTSVYLGIEKGIKRLSNANVVFALVFVTIIAFIGGINKTLSFTLNSAGLYLGNFFELLTSTEPFGDGLFFKNWSLFILAWGCSYAPLSAIFNAKVSKGRTFREIAFVQIVASCIIPWFVSMTLGNYTADLQISGALDIASILETEGQAAAIVAILKTMPMAKAMMVSLVILVFMFVASTMDSVCYVAAEATTIHITSDEPAPRWNRIIWAVISAFGTVVLQYVGGFDAVELLALLLGIPMSILIFAAVFIVARMVRRDDKEISGE